MTAADPNGVFVDTIRTCYASWMRVPEYADPIRVRWYKIDRPPPGSYPITEYSSSDWDEDPKSGDPDLGEQSTLREPFKDWRDCSPPPWCPYEDWLPGAATFQHAAYQLKVSGVLDTDGNPSPLNGEWLLVKAGDIGTWQGELAVGTGAVGWELGEVELPGFLVLAGVSSLNPGVHFQGNYRIPMPAEMDVSITFELFETPGGGTFPVTVTLVGTSCRPIVTESKRRILTEDGFFLISE